MSLKIEIYQQIAQRHGAVAWRILILIARRRGRPISTGQIVDRMRYWHDRVIRVHLRELRAAGLVSSRMIVRGKGKLSWRLGGPGAALLEGENLRLRWITEFPIGENPYIKVR